MCVISNVYIIEDNGILDHAVVTNIALFKDDGILYYTVDDTSTGYQTVAYLGTGIVFCGGQIIHLGIYIRILFEEIISDICLQEIHIGAVVIFYRSDVSPIILDLISIDSLQILVTDQNVSYEIISVFFRTFLDHLDQKSASNHIDAAGNGVGLGLKRFLFELFDPALFIHTDRTKALYIGAGFHITTYYRDIRLLLNMIFQYFVVIQFVYTVTGSNHYIRFMAVL